MQLHGTRNSEGRPLVTDWEVTIPNGATFEIPKVHFAYVEEKTGTLHFVAADGSTIDSFARGFWARVKPTS
jgi:hypothetical protein